MLVEEDVEVEMGVALGGLLLVLIEVGEVDVLERVDEVGVGADVAVVEMW